MSATRMTLAGLLALGMWLLVTPPAGPAAAPAARLLIGVLCAAPLALLVLAGLRRVRQWGAWVAITMIPYFALSVGAMLVAPPGQRLEGAAFATLIAVVFFTGIAATRQRP